MLKVAQAQAKRFVAGDGEEADGSVVDYSFLRQLGASGSAREEEERKRLDSERQLLLTVLLAQVCAQQDVTPKTFCEQVVRLYERGIIDSVQLLYDSRFVSPPLLQRLDRASEATAIRASFDSRRPLGSRCGNMAASGSAPGALLMSRYERDYEELGLIARGAFGDVYRARHRLDGNEYAIKKVTFRGARGLDSPRAQLSLREVTNLSRLDHPNVVRYYSAWLDSSFLARIGISSGAEDGHAAAAAVRPQLLAPLEETSPTGAAEASLSSAAEAGSETSAAAAEAAARAALREDPPAWVEEVSEWSAPADGTSLGAADDVSSVSGAGGRDGGGDSRRFPYYSGYGDDDDDDAVAFVRQESDARASVSSAMLPSAATAELPGQGHSITLFISMGLCPGDTLQEWLRVRNRRIAVRRATSADLGATMSAAAAAAAAEEAHGGGQRSAGSSPLPLTRQRSWSAGSDSSPSTMPGGASDREVDMAEALNLFRQLIQGLAHVHAKKLLHRDCKPENIFLLEDDEGGRVVKLGDFGLSTANAAGSGAGGEGSASDEETSREESELARRTIGVGTASYAAPENLSGPHYGPLSDVFSCGLILLELACPFQTAHERAAAFGAVRRSPPAVPAGLQRRHPQVAALVLRLTAADAAMRPTAAEVLEWELLRSPTPEEAALRHQLAEKDAVIEQLRARLDELSAAASPEAGS